MRGLIFKEPIAYGKKSLKQCDISNFKKTVDIDNYLTLCFTCRSLLLFLYLI